MSRKNVTVLGYQFDCLPAHITIPARGHGSSSSVRIATQRAISKMLTDQRLRRKQIGDFKISVVVLENSKDKT
jgi:hypothetical protein